MRQYDVWYAIPSASVERCRKTLPAWRAKGYKIAVLQNQERGEIPADIVEWSDTYPGWSESINILCRRIVPKTADIVVSGGCDMLPDPNHTAQELAEQFYQHFPDGFGVMQPHGDEYMNAKEYCGSPFLGRAWIDKMYGGNGPMFGGYRHNWGDVELYWVAKCIGRLWSRPDLTHFHAHFNRAGASGAEAPPEWWIRNVHRHDKHDVELFISRKWLRFPGHEPVGMNSKFDPQPLFADNSRIAERHYESHFSKMAQYAMEKALATCKANGWNRVAIYGAGRHTRNVIEAIADSPVDIQIIIEDNPAKFGSKFCGFPLVSRAQALTHNVQAVVLSSYTTEGAMWDSCGDFFARDIPVLRLYQPPVDERVRRVRRATERSVGEGRARIALYGAGTHTRELSAEAFAPGAELVCVIDDLPKAGEQIHGAPVLTPEQAVELKPQAVILSSSLNEEALEAKAGRFKSLGAEVIRLYAPPVSGGATRGVALKSVA
jgi:hypothetical protein